MIVKIKEETYNKLVRDKVPKIIEKSGNRCHTIVLADQNYQQALRQKLIEEATEVANTSQVQLVQGLAD